MKVARILVNDYAGHPFQIQLSRALAAQGHEVAHLYCSTNVTPHGDLTDHGSDTLSIVPISTGSTFEKYSILRRVRDEFRYGRASARFQRSWKPDVVICSNMPVVSLNALQSLDRTMPMVVWLQDIQSALASLVLDDWRKHLHRPLAWLEKRAIKRAEAVIAIADSLANDACALGVDPSCVTVIENWAPIDDLPVLPRDNEWADQHGLDDHFVFLYSGTLGIKHRPDLLADLASSFRNDDAVRVVVASEGIGADQLAAEVRRRALDNVVLLPFQDFSDLAAMLASADVLTVVLEQSAGSASIPSKVLSYLCAGRPILASLPHANSSTTLIEERANAGLAATSDEAFIANAHLLREDSAVRTQLGTNGRAYAEDHFRIATIAQRFLAVIEPMIDVSTEPTIDLTDGPAAAVDGDILAPGGNR